MPDRDGGAIRGHVPSLVETTVSSIGPFKRGRGTGASLSEPTRTPISRNATLPARRALSHLTTEALSSSSASNEGLSGGAPLKAETGAPRFAPLPRVFQSASHLFGVAHETEATPGIRMPEDGFTHFVSCALPHRIRGRRRRTPQSPIEQRFTDFGPRNVPCALWLTSSFVLDQRAQVWHSGNTFRIPLVAGCSLSTPV